MNLHTSHTKVFGDTDWANDAKVIDINANGKQLQYLKYIAASKNEVSYALTKKKRVNCFTLIFSIIKSFEGDLKMTKSYSKNLLRFNI